MKPNRSFIAIAFALLTLASAASALAQQQPRPISPRRTVELMFGQSPNQKKVLIDYGSPSARGRKVMGELVPYEKVWRLGANKATHLTTEVDLMIGGTAVPAGTYTLFAVPAPSGWKLIVNKTTGQWGIPYKPEYEKTELARIDMKTEQLPHPVERFLITLDRVGADYALIVEWDTARASVNFNEKK